jgi:hypothetical protein
MKTIVIALLLLTPLSTIAQETHKAKTPRAGDTVLPGTPAWIHAGSPRSSITGDSIALICGADGALHPLGYAIEGADGSWVANTPKNRETIEDHKETMRLKLAVAQIMRDMPDRKIPKPVTNCNVTVTTTDTGYNPYIEILKWADSIANVFDDQYFYQEMKNYYQSPRNGLGQTPFDDPIKS